MHRNAGSGTAAAAICGGTPPDMPPASTMADLRIGQNGLVAIPAPTVPGAQALYRFWQERRPEGASALNPCAALPQRDDFTFDALKQIGVLGHEFVIEPIEGGRDWRYRLVGTSIVWMFGRDPTNVPFTQHFIPEEAAQCIAFSNRVAQSCQPVFLRARFASKGHSATLLETMSLPVLGRGGGEVWLIGASYPVSE